MVLMTHNEFTVEHSVSYYTLGCQNILWTVRFISIHKNIQ